VLSAGETPGRWLAKNVLNFLRKRKESREEKKGTKDQSKKKEKMDSRVCRTLREKVLPRVHLHRKHKSKEKKRTLKSATEATLDLSKDGKPKAKKKLSRSQGRKDGWTTNPILEKIVRREAVSMDQFYCKRLSPTKGSKTRRLRVARPCCVFIEAKKFNGPNLPRSLSADER